MDTRSLRLVKNAYFSHITHTKQFSLVTFYNAIVGIGQHETLPTPNEWTDKKVEVFM